MLKINIGDKVVAKKDMLVVTADNITALVQKDEIAYVIGFRNCEDVPQIVLSFINGVTETPVKTFLNKFDTRIYTEDRDIPTHGGVICEDHTFLLRNGSIATIGKLSAHEDGTRHFKGTLSSHPTRTFIWNMVGIFIGEEGKVANENHWYDIVL